MQIIKRKVTCDKGYPIALILKAIAFNSNEVLTLTLSLEDEERDLLININGEELNKLKRFIKRIE